MKLTKTQLRGLIRETLETVLGEQEEEKPNKEKPQEKAKEIPEKKPEPKKAEKKPEPKPEARPKPKTPKPEEKPEMPQGQDKVPIEMDPGEDLEQNLKSNPMDPETMPGEEMAPEEEGENKLELVNDRLAGQHIQGAKVNLMDNGVELVLELVGTKLPAILKYTNDGRLIFNYKGQAYILT